VSHQHPHGLGNSPAAPSSGPQKHPQAKGFCGAVAMTLLAALALFPRAAFADGAPQGQTIHATDVASACEGIGGTYLGDAKCRMPDGSLHQMLSGLDAGIARMSTKTIAPGTPQAWTLAVTALTFEVNQQRHDTLTGVMLTPQARARDAELLAKWWNINNRDELRHMLDWLQYQGQRAEFEALGRLVDGMSDEQFRDAESRAPDDAARHRLQLVRARYDTLGTKGILAWDLVRYIQLYRWGYAAGYLGSDQDVWNRIIPVALRLQQTFSSWEDLQSDFLIGREFWSPEETERSGAQFRVTYERLLQDPGSPWNVNPWDMDLGVTVPLQISKYPPCHGLLCAPETNPTNP
jgi:hypothetical protein